MTVREHRESAEVSSLLVLHALLLERCDPGTSVGQESESVVDSVSFELLRQTWPASDAFLRLRSLDVLVTP